MHAPREMTTLQATFSLFVTLYRDTLLPPPALSGEDHQSGLPPPQFSATYTTGGGASGYETSYGGASTGAGASAEGSYGDVPVGTSGTAASVL